MTVMEKLQKTLTARFPQATAELEHLRAASVLDVHLHERVYVITWRSGRGFGLFLDQDDPWRSLSGAPDEAFASLSAVQSRLIELLGRPKKRASMR